MCYLLSNHFHSTHNTTVLHYIFLRGVWSLKAEISVTLTVLMRAQALGGAPGPVAWRGEA